MYVCMFVLHDFAESAYILVCAFKCVCVSWADERFQFVQTSQPPNTASSKAMSCFCN